MNGVLSKLYGLFDKPIRGYVQDDGTAVLGVVQMDANGNASAVPIPLISAILGGRKQGSAANVNGQIVITVPANKIWYGTISVSVAGSQGPGIAAGVIVGSMGTDSTGIPATNFIGVTVELQATVAAGNGTNGHQAKTMSGIYIAGGASGTNLKVVTFATGTITDANTDIDCSAVGVLLN